MATEAVNKILQKEKDADSRISEARLYAKQQSEQLIKDSGAEAAKLITEAKQKAASVIKDASLKSEAVYSEATGQAEKKCELLKQKNSGLKEKAVEITADILF